IAFLALIAVAAVYVPGYTVASAALNFLLFVPLVYGNNLLGLLTAPASRLLGTISYSIYLCHGFVLFAFHYAMQHTVGVSNVPMPLYWSLVCCAAALTTLL